MRKKLLEALRTIKSNHTFFQKLNYIKYIFSSKKTILNYDPITISIVPTGKCTFKCDMCPTHSKIIPDTYPYIQEPVKDMELDTFKQIIDKFHTALNVQIIGSGEPLLNKDFFEMVEYATSKKMKVKTFSNGTTIEENIDNIINSKLDGITISINSANSEDFERLTGNKKEFYEKVYNSVKKLIEKRNKINSNVKIKISFIVDKQNYQLIPDIIKIIEDIEPDITFICNFLPSPFEGFTVEERTLNIEDKDIISNIKEFHSKLPKNLKKKVSFPTILNQNTKVNKCNSHFSQIRINGEGDISSCSVMLLNMKGKGHFKDKEVWNNNFFQEMRKKFLRNEKEILDNPCKVCIENYGIDLF